MVLVFRENLNVLSFLAVVCAVADPAAKAIGANANVFRRLLRVVMGG
jgi:hypothetical protein